MLIPQSGNVKVVNYGCSMRRKKMSTLLTVVAGVMLFGIAGTFSLSLTASRPEGLGVKDGRLAEAPATPNCVSTQATERSHWIAPLTFRASPANAMQTLREVVSGMAGSTVIEQNGHYLYAEFCSSVFRFTDDVEFLMETESNRIHFRSASRVGHSDLGANRDRMENIRALFEAADQVDFDTDSSVSEPVLEPAMSE